VWVFVVDLRPYWQCFFTKNRKKWKSSTVPR